MASIRKEISIHAPADAVWGAMRDVGAVHIRLVPGVLTHAELEGDVRIVTFANGAIVRERIIDIDDTARRLAYTVVGGRFSHHSASMQVLPDGPAHSRVVWVTDMLPNELVPAISALVDQGAQAMKRTMESDA